MILLDSSCWIEIFVKGKSSTEFVRLVKENGKNNTIVSSISIYEVMKFFLKKISQEKAIFALEFMKSFKVIDIDHSLATQAAKLSVEFELPMADSLIYSTALSQNSELITMDPNFKNLPHVKYFRKK